ncbi:hypothetical protein MUP65_01195 [Patescibacteria group bacterium]|nr:hypothetical protein [Patescibacteria group bacterium]
MPSSPSPLSKNKGEEKTLVKSEIKTFTQSPLMEKKGEVKKKKEVKAKKPAIPYPYLHLGLGLLGTVLILVGICLAHQKLVLFATQAEENKSQLAALQESNVGQLSLHKQFESVEEYQLDIYEAFPNEETIVDFFVLFKRLIGEATVEAFDFQTDQPVVEVAGSPYIGFTAQISGKADQLEMFLERFSQQPYLVSFTLVDLEQNGSGEARLIIQARLEVDQNFYLQINE